MKQRRSDGRVTEPRAIASGIEIQCSHLFQSGSGVDSSGIQLETCALIPLATARGSVTPVARFAGSQVQLLARSPGLRPGLHSAAVFDGSLSCSPARDYVAREQPSAS